MIVTWESPRWRARKKAKIRVDVDFVPVMERVDAFAKVFGVTIYVTQSLRDPKKEVSGAVVKPAVMSNHLVGHGIDFNLIDSDGVWYNSGKLGRFTKLPKHIQGFIQAIRDADGLRWGGDFRTPDVIHFDDMLNKRDPDEWWRKFKELWP